MLASTTAAMLLAPVAAPAAEPVPDEALLEFLGGVDEVEDEDFQEYLADVDVKRVAKGEKPGLPRLDVRTHKPKSDKPKSEEP